MKNKFFIAALAIFIAGCYGGEERRTIKRLYWFCPNDAKKEIAEFKLKCIENANPKSDEEPEDWLMLCEKMAHTTYCKEETFIVNQWRPNSNSFFSDESIKKVGE